MNQGSIINLDLLIVGVAIAGNLILGFVVFFEKIKSATRILFFILTIVLSAWSLINYFSYQAADYQLSLLLVRLVMFFAALIGGSFLLFIDAFPTDKLRMSKRNMYVVLFFTALTMIISLTNLLFPQITINPGGAPKPEFGPGIISFLVVPILAIIFSLIILVFRGIHSSGIERQQYKYLSFGLLVMFGLIILLNFILPAFFQNTRFIPIGALFTLPFVILTTYAIVRHQLMNAKIITTEIITFVLAIVTLFEVVISKDVITLVFRFGVFSLVLAFGILLIRSVRKEVEEREKIEVLAKQLQDVNAKLDNLSRFKSQMLSLAAHQIKAPLATIKGFSTILIDGLYGPITDKIKDTLKKIRFSSDDLINLINTLLDLRHVEEGKMDYNFQAVKIKDVATEAFEIIKFPAQQKGIQFTLDCSTEASVNADPQKLKQVLQNLIDNAVKYTPEGFVKVELKEEDNSIIFSVTDSGLGIPADLLPHLFDEEFVRDERVKKEILGTGLGLYIAKKIINDHRGEIGVKSDGPGKGSCFFVKLKKI